MRKLPWTLGAMVAVIALIVAGVVVGPALYKAARGGDDAPAATVMTDGAEAAVGDLDGSWSVIPGSEPNLTAAGYTVAEILRGEPVTVVGSTDEVSGRLLRLPVFNTLAPRDLERVVATLLAALD